ncbi:MAG: translation initiation factor [Stigonema ocellatum SAG 48.90 = DSM 106950]|nr:translation initiation factor [Stigonema ocellatum SAG 48.90 = DSM 106950]
MVDDFIRKAKDLLLGGNDAQKDAEYGDRQPRPASEDPYGDAGDQNNYGAIPASQDPYGDPADSQGQYGDVRPASEDPYGDPADNPGQYGDVRPASEDPYGDPADR